MQTEPTEQPGQDDKLLLIGLMIFVIALILRLAYVNTVVVDHPIRADAEKYFHLAYNLVVNHIYSVTDKPPFTPSTYITPGYPLFLAAGMKLFSNFNSFYNFILNIQALLDSLSVLLIFLISQRFMPLSFAILAALSPHLIAASGYVLTETLFTFFLTLTIFVSTYALKRKEIYLAIILGILFGAAALVRPVLMLFPFVLLVIIWQVKREHLSLKWSGALLLGFVLVWSPWQLWKNQNINLNEPSLAPASFALGIYPDLIYKNPELQGFPYNDDSEYANFSTSFAKTMPVLIERASAQPLTYLKWYLWGKPKMYWQANNNIAAFGGPFIYPVEKSMYHKIPATAYSLLAMMAVHPFLIILGVGVTVLLFLQFLRRNQQYIEGYICSSLVLYFTAIHTVLTPLPRYSYPVIPFVYLLACFMLYQIWHHARFLLKKDK